MVKVIDLFRVSEGLLPGIKGLWSHKVGGGDAQVELLLPIFDNCNWVYTRWQ